MNYYVGIVKHHRVRLGSLLDTGKKRISYAKLIEACRSLLDGQDVEITYQDVDGDLCIIDSTHALLEAIQQFKDTTRALKVQAIAMASSRRDTSSCKKQGETQTEATDTFTESNAENIATNVDNGSVHKRLLRALRGPSSMDRGDETDDDVDPQDLEEADPDLVRSHLVDQFMDHVNLDGAPEFYSSPPSEDEDPSGEQLEEPVYALYKINGKTCKSRLFAMDDIYLDLADKDEPLPPRCVGFAIPALFMDTLVMGSLDGPPPESSSSLCSLEPVAVEFDPNLPPKVVGYREERDANGNLTGSVEPSQQGNLMEMMQSSEHRHFYRCSGVFEAANTGGGIALNLIELVVFGAHDDLLSSLTSSGGDESQ